MVEGRLIFFIKFYMNYLSGLYCIMNYIYKINVMLIICVRICEDLLRVVIG